MESDLSWWRIDAAGGAVARVLAKPGARRTEVAGVADGALVVRLAARPVDGAANRELERFLAELLDVPRSAVRVERGTAARHKAVRIDGPLDGGRLAAIVDK